MSDSLREQMLKAGFKETASAKKKPPKKTRAKKSAAANSSSAAKPHAKNAALIAENIANAAKKKLKAQIKQLIEENKAEKTSGEIAHSYLVGKRIKQLFVNEDTRKKIVEGELVITRLNGSTYLIPADIGDQVLSLNPDWIVITPASSDTPSEDDDYADYQVPDDLQW
jgi:uncharacterized protein YaiL (DUF2058 family)